MHLGDCARRLTAPHFFDDFPGSGFDRWRKTPFEGQCPALLLRVSIQWTNLSEQGSKPPQRRYPILPWFADQSGSLWLCFKSARLDHAFVREFIEMNVYSPVSAELNSQ